MRSSPAEPPSLGTATRSWRVRRTRSAVGLRGTGPIMAEIEEDPAPQRCRILIAVVAWSAGAQPMVF